MKYDYLIVGAGIYGATIARILTDAGKKCLVIDKRAVIGGNCSTYENGGIVIHEHGPHIFHTDNKDVWNFVNQFDEFVHFINQPVANYYGTIYNLPFNMNTFSKMFGISTPAEAKMIIKDEIRRAKIMTTSNLEEQAILMVGTTIYERLIKGYTEKQWGKPCTELSPSIIKRLPLRFTYNNNYYSDIYQGIPRHGYSKLIDNMLKDVDVSLDTEFKEVEEQLYDKIIYTGSIDVFFDCCFGMLDYRSLKFETEIKLISNYQGNAVVNYTSSKVPYTRIIEHQFFLQQNETRDFTIITKEYPKKFESVHDERYYPLDDEHNMQLYQKYVELAKASRPDVFFGGRLGKYRYFDMDDAIIEAMKDAEYLVKRDE